MSHSHTHSHNKVSAVGISKGITRYSFKKKCNYFVINYLLLEVKRRHSNIREDFVSSDSIFRDSNQMNSKYGCIINLPHSFLDRWQIIFEIESLLDELPVLLSSNLVTSLHYEKSTLITVMDCVCYGLLPTLLTVRLYWILITCPVFLSLAASVLLVPVWTQAACPLSGHLSCKLS